MRETHRGVGQCVRHNLTVNHRIISKITAIRQTHAALQRHLNLIEQEDRHEEEPMKNTPRWINSAIAASANVTSKMPWERGLRRQAFMASRRAVAAIAEAPSRTMRPAA